MSHFYAFVSQHVLDTLLRMFATCNRSYSLEFFGMALFNLENEYGCNACS